MKLNIFSTFLFFVTIFALLSCGGENEQAVVENETAKKALSEEYDSKENKPQQIFYSLPSPFELASMLRNSGASFNKDILNSPENISNYSTSSVKAFNLGVYGADLSYASIYSQTQNSMEFLNCVKKLSDDLGISAAFDPKSMERMEANKGNDDSLQQIVSEGYLIANSFLKQNDREDLSTFVLAGGFLEGVYIATQLIKTDSENEELLMMIADQKFAIENLVALLEKYDDTSVADMKKDFNELNTLFSELEINIGEQEFKIDAKNNTTVIGGGDRTMISDEQLLTITTKVESIRNKYVS